MLWEPSMRLRHPLVPLLVLGACAVACGGSPPTSTLEAPADGGGDVSTPSPPGPMGADSGAPPVRPDASLDASMSTLDAADGESVEDGVAPLGPLVLYASGYGPNIDLFAIAATSPGGSADAAAAGALSLLATTPAFGASPSFLAINRAVTHLYAVDEATAGRVGAYAIEPSTGALTFQNDVSSGGDGPPFVTLDHSEAFILVANYGDGSVSVIPVQADGSLAAPSSTLQVGTNAHMILPDPSNRYVFVPCLGSDYVAQFLFDATTGVLTPNAVPYVNTASGAGPRHLAFAPSGKVAYLLNEKNSTLSAYAFDASAGTLAETQTVTTLPAGFSGTNTAAEVWVHPTGKWVLTSNRGDDSIAVFPLDQSSGAIGTPTFTKSGGTAPRDFTIDPTGNFVFAANQGTSTVVPFRFDPAQGTLTAAGPGVSVQGASFVEVVRLAP